MSKLVKCVFGAQQKSYLGHMVSSIGFLLSLIKSQE